MKTDIRSANGVTIVDVHGKITIGEGSIELRHRLRELLQAGKKDVLLNLGDVSYLDSSGIGELVSCYTTVANQGGRLKLLNLTKKVQELLTITKLLTVFESYEDEAKAIASFS
jgi:anti-sigma B factor antagonist